MNMKYILEYNKYEESDKYKTDFDYSNHYVFDEFFISLKEERKLKLEKINEKTNI